MAVKDVFLAWLLPVLGPGVRRQHGCWYQVAPSQREKAPWPGYSICTVWPRLWSREDTAAGNLLTGDSVPTTHLSYLDKHKVREGVGLVPTIYKGVYNSFYCIVAHLTISVLEDSRMFDESNISLSTCKAPEWTDRQTQVVVSATSSLFYHRK